MLADGMYGDRNDTPNDCRVDASINWINIPTAMPRKPAMNARMI